MVDVAAIDGRIGPVVEFVVLVHETNRSRPVVHRVGPLRIGLIVGVPCQSCRHVEEAAIRDGILVIVTVVEGENLPSETSATRQVVPSRCLLVEDSLD